MCLGTLSIYKVTKRGKVVKNVDANKLVGLVGKMRNSCLSAYFFLKKYQTELAIKEVVIKKCGKGENFEERGSQSRYFQKMGA